MCINNAIKLTMSIEKMPPIQISSTDPVVLGEKHTISVSSTHLRDYELINKDHQNPLTEYFGIPAPLAYDQGFTKADVEEEVQHLPQDSAQLHYGNVKYVMDITETSRLEKMGSQMSIQTDSNAFNSESECDNESVTEPDCRFQLKQVGKCFAVIQKVSSRHDFNTRRTSLPGEVDYDELSEAIPKNSQHEQHFPEDTRNNNLWSFNLLHKCTSRSEKFLEYCSNVSVQMRKFIIKLQNAIVSEEQYIARLNLFTQQYLNQSGSIVPHGFNLHDQEEEINLSPPKFGKVYIELQTHYKAWDDVMKNWQRLRQGGSMYMLKQLLNIQRRIKLHQTKMLELSQTLIILRLCSLTSCAVVRTKKDEGDCDWGHILGAGSMKRFSKLIEAYNNILRRNAHEKSQSPESGRTSSPFVMENIPASLHTEKKRRIFSADDAANAPSLFSVARLLSILCEPAAEDLASAISKIISLLRTSTSCSEEEEFYTYTSADVDWGNAKDVQQDEDDITTHICGHPLPLIPDTNASAKTFSAVRKLVYSQSTFVISFMKCLAGNTSLLRGRRKSKSPRPTSFSQVYPEDLPHALSSDDEVSSVASSSFFSQRSGTPSSMRMKKTVLWRDSWDQDAMRSFSKLYITTIISEGPATVFQRQVEKFSSLVSGPSSELLSFDAGYLRQRFSSGMLTLQLESLLNNLPILDLLGEDVVKNAQKSLQLSIIKKALADWDSYTCQALAVGGMDKCGSIPVEGTQQALTKTGWTFVKTIHPLMYIMDRFRENEYVAQNALPRLEATLDTLHRWCHGKIHLFLSSWSLRPLMQVSLGDLSQLTVVALHCLPLVEKCHNFVESRRMDSPATLHFATGHLKNIDDIITNMQTLSGDCMRAYLKKSAHLAQKLVTANFPSSKLWRQKNLTDHSCASPYMEQCVESLVAPVCTAVSVLDPRSQLASVPPMVSALVDAILQHIFQKKIIFSVQGAMQLQRDLEHILDVACSDNFQLCRDVRRTLPFCKSMKRGMWVSKLLQRTDVPTDTKTGTKGRNPQTDDDIDFKREDVGWMIKEKEILSLRLLSKNGKKKWFSLPCSGDAMD